MRTTLHSPELHAVGYMRREWFVAFGGVTLVVVLSLWTSPVWQPLFELLIAFVLLVFSRNSRRTGSHPCCRLAKCTSYALIITAIISFTINLLFHTEFILYFFDRATLNESIPYITPLIVFPALAVVSSFNATKGVCDAHSHRCYLHNEYNPSQPHLGRVIHNVYGELLSCLALICLAISVIDWFYYSFFYQNVSINTPDRFFFFVFPSAIYIWSIFHIRERYTSLLLPTGRPIVEADNTADKMTEKSVLRFLIVNDDRLLLDVSATTLADCLIDTPTVVSDALYNDYPVARAGDKFIKLSQLSPDSFSIKELYASTNTTNTTKIYHYLINITADGAVVEQSTLPAGEWTTLDGIDRFMKMGVLSPALIAEIFRIYTVAMAWKAYDRHGRRRYPIRRYRPNFRLRDVHKWDVDYNDPIWTKIARHNEDSPGWFIRRFFIHNKNNRDKCQ